MISLNKAMIIGNITRDPEIRYTPSGQGVCNFSIATNRRFKNTAGDVQEETQYHDVVAWGKLAELITQMVKKGNKIYVEGRLQTRQWDAPDGTKRSRTEIVLEQFVPLAPKAAGQNFNDTSNDSSTPPQKPKPAAKNTKTEPAPAQEEEINLDDIPF